MQEPKKATEAEIMAAFRKCVEGAPSGGAVARAMGYLLKRVRDNAEWRAALMNYIALVEDAERKTKV